MAGVDKGLRPLCGMITMPRDQGKKLVDHIDSNNQSLIGVSDALVNKQCGRHAWILITESNKHFLNPDLVISSVGPVYGLKSDMSSAHAELQEQMAMAIMAKFLKNVHQLPKLKVSFFYDNQGIIKGCAKPANQWIRDHRKANMDLYLEYWSTCKDLNVNNTRIKGHQDKGCPWQTIHDLQKNWSSLWR
jgi:hypothetical protein